MLEEVWLTKDMLRAFAKERGHSEQNVTRLWIALARIDAKLKKAGKSSFILQVNVSPYREWVKDELTRSEQKAGVRVALSTIRQAWKAHQINPRMVTHYSEVSHDLLRQWLESFGS